MTAGDARLVLIDLVQASADRRREEDRHAAHELIAVVGGRYAVRVGDRRLVAQPGELVLMPAGTPHAPQFRVDVGTRIHVLQWTQPGPLAGQGPAVLRDPAGRVLFLLDWLWQVHGHGPAATRQRLLSLLVDEIAALRAAEAAGTTGDPAVRKALRFMESDLHRALGRHEIAAAAGLSPAQLARRMRLATGLPPGRQLRRLRAAAAVSLLRGTDLDQLEIARRVGLRSAAHLNRLVRTHTGRAPGALRRGS